MPNSPGAASLEPIGSASELEVAGRLTGKLGSRPVCVFLDDGRPYALEDRCPHMGFPLHRGTVESGLLTCHWHHARFDLSSGGTLDPFADDVTAFSVEIVDGVVYVGPGAESDRVARLRARLLEGLEQSITLVIAKAVIGLLDRGVPAREIVRIGIDFGVRYRGAGWGTGLTVLVAMADVLDSLRPEDHALALVHGLALVARDTARQPPRFPLGALRDPLPLERLTAWYRRFVDTRATDAAERALASAVESADQHHLGLVTLMASAIVDHVFIDEGHVVDFTNKAFEALDLIGPEHALLVLPTLVPDTVGARRLEEGGQWRHPIDLTALLVGAAERIEGLLAGGIHGPQFGSDATSELAGVVAGDDPSATVEALDRALAAGATPEQLARAVAYAAALRILRFHTQNDHGDWNEVHHAFTAANALHQLVVRSPSVPLLVGVYQCALRVYLDRFLNVPAARPPSRITSDATLEALERCWDLEGEVDAAGAAAYRYLESGGDPAELIEELGRALLREDASFHWYQLYEAAVRQCHAWGPESEQGRLILSAFARFLAAHTPTRRELSQVVHIAERLGRGEPLYEDSEA